MTTLKDILIELRKYAQECKNTVGIMSNTHAYQRDTGRYEGATIAANKLNAYLVSIDKRPENEAPPASADALTWALSFVERFQYDVDGYKEKLASWFARATEAGRQQGLREAITKVRGAQEDFEHTTAHPSKDYYNFTENLLGRLESMVTLKAGAPTVVFNHVGYRQKLSEIRRSLDTLLARRTLNGQERLLFIREQGAVQLCIELFDRLLPASAQPKPPPPPLPESIVLGSTD